MNEMLKIYRCESCGNIIVKLFDSTVTPFCCGSKMTELCCNSTEGHPDAHIPEITKCGQTVKVKVGTKDHPMTKEHHIEWVILCTTDGFIFKKLEPDCHPCVEFLLPEGEQPIAAYAYCNLHGLWNKEC